MIERKFVANNVKEFQIKEFVKKSLGRVGLSNVKLQKTPLGEKIIIVTSRPGLVVGRSGSNISRITKSLKKEFNLENPQIEIEEVKYIGLDANIIAEMIAGSLERFGSQRFKGVGHKAMTDVMSAGALGVEILISGKIPSSRAKTWRFYQGYLKKCGDISVSGVLKAYAIAKLKTGIVGIQVSIMPSTIILPDRIKVLSELQEVIEEVKGVEAEKITEDLKVEEIKSAEEQIEKKDEEDKPSKPKKDLKAKKPKVEKKEDSKKDKKDSNTNKLSGGDI
ncbi:MAG: 30S ribosomal protein S3 [Nanoarchaeota archaeon]|nr:30S ribosomal protein S3 [Nanoarchaeota archaeon]MBU1269132.1 30S ribosomal protein S3 [Nanoarchaeota archaeon]MBU1605094.1 30S ribosomal protein S3 [Nanoarchaeota archaeon]MBU2442775.1 30S ribosomal protein S3 [Nanoarchaeota archaeon]